MYDFIDAGKYARRGLAAARWYPVGLRAFRLEFADDKIPELTESRARLGAALERDVRTRPPDGAADAQGNLTAGSSSKRKTTNSTICGLPQSLPSGAVDP
jgi:hypothetical protein